jgi:MoxR-like ATPase
VSSPAVVLSEIRTELRHEFYEREDAIDALILATLARQHAFILGLPGTGKSLLVRAFVDRIIGATYFEQLLSKNRPDSAVLGPYDLPLLRDKGVFRRRDCGYLTSVHFSFLDEVGKVSPTLGHDLLAALNERIKHEVTDDGRSHQKIPLHSAFTASNELPAADSEDQAALWDRLLVRCVVDYIGNDSQFKALMDRADNSVATPTTITLEDLQAACEDVSRVVLLDDVLDAVLKIRAELRRDGITVSDRRWRESMKVVRANAFLAGRAVASLEDLTALRFTLWEDLEQKGKIERVILSVASPADAEVAVLLDGVAELAATLKAKEGESGEKLFAYGSELFAKCNGIDKRAKTIAKKASEDGRTVNVDKVHSAVEQVRAHAMRIMGIEA